MQSRSTEKYTRSHGPHGVDLHCIQRVHGSGIDGQCGSLIDQQGGQLPEEKNSPLEFHATGSGSSSLAGLSYFLKGRCYLMNVRDGHESFVSFDQRSEESFSDSSLVPENSNAKRTVLACSGSPEDLIQRNDYFEPVTVTHANVIDKVFRHWHEKNVRGCTLDACIQRFVIWYKIDWGCTHEFTDFTFISSLHGRNVKGCTLNRQFRVPPHLHWTFAWLFQMQRLGYAYFLFLQIAVYVASRLCFLHFKLGYQYTGEEFAWHIARGTFWFTATVTWLWTQERAQPKRLQVVQKRRFSLPIRTSSSIKHRGWIFACLVLNSHVVAITHLQGGFGLDDIPGHVNERQMGTTEIDKNFTVQFGIVDNAEDGYAPTPYGLSLFQRSLCIVLTTGSAASYTDQFVEAVWPLTSRGERNLSAAADLDPDVLRQRWLDIGARNGIPRPIGVSTYVVHRLPQVRIATPPFELTLARFDDPFGIPGEVEAHWPELQMATWRLYLCHSAVAQSRTWIGIPGSHFILQYGLETSSASFVSGVVEVTIASDEDEASMLFGATIPSRASWLHLWNWLRLGHGFPQNSVFSLLVNGCFHSQPHEALLLSTGFFVQISIVVEDAQEYNGIPRGKAKLMMGELCHGRPSGAGEVFRAAATIHDADQARISYDRRDEAITRRWPDLTVWTMHKLHPTGRTRSPPWKALQDAWLLHPHPDGMHIVTLAALFEGGGCREYYALGVASSWRPFRNLPSATLRISMSGSAVSMCGHCQYTAGDFGRSFESR